jgi:hypothetical protein
MDAIIIDSISNHDIPTVMKSKIVVSGQASPELSFILFYLTHYKLALLIDLTVVFKIFKNR